MRAVGIALEVFAVVVTAVLIVAACQRRNITKKPECYVLLLTCSNFLALLCDLMLLFIYRDARLTPLYCVLWIFDYAFALTYVLFLHCYLVHFIARRKKISTKLILPDVLLCGVMICLWVISIFNGMFYKINYGNVFSYTDYFILSQLGPALSMMLDFVIILIYRKALGLRDTLIWMIYIILPTAMIALESKYDAVPVYLAMTISSMIIYIMISTEQDKRLAEQKLEMAEKTERLMLSQIQPHFYTIR